MTDRVVGFGIVGCGMIAGHHARAIAASRGGKLLAVYSRDRARAEAFAREHGAQAAHSLEELLAHPGLEVLTVATPSGAHLEPVLAAAAAGKHVLVEKPLEVTLERIDRMIAACAVARVHLAAVFQARFGRGARKVKEVVASGRLGRLTVCDATVKWYRSQAYYDEGGWRGTWKWDGGGALMNQSIHAIDLLQWLAGMPQTVGAFAATLGHTGIEVEDTAAAALRFPGGELGTIVGTTAAWPGYTRRIELNGDAGSVALEDDRIVRQCFGAPSELRSGSGSPQMMNARGHELQVQDLVEAISEGRAPAIQGREARNAVAIIQAIYKSSRDGHAVEVDGVRDTSVCARAALTKPAAFKFIRR